jgi:hypothetical protein
MNGLRGAGQEYTGKHRRDDGRGLPGRSPWGGGRAEPSGRPIADGRTVPGAAPLPGPGPAPMPGLRPEPRSWSDAG